MISYLWIPEGETYPRGRTDGCDCYSTGLVCLGCRCHYLLDRELTSSDPESAVRLLNDYRRELEKKLADVEKMLKIFIA